MAARASSLSSHPGSSSRPGPQGGPLRPGWRVPFVSSPWAHAAFAVAWVGAQGALIATAGERADAMFGFRMFAESSTIRAHLTREVEAPSGHGTVDVPVSRGEWTAKDARGTPHALRWRDRVIEPALATFDTTMPAAYSAAAQVARWKGALDDVAGHLGDDGETRRLRLDLTVLRNGHETTTYHFSSSELASTGLTSPSR